MRRADKSLIFMAGRVSQDEQLWSDLRPIACPGMEVSCIPGLIVGALWGPPVEIDLIYSRLRPEEWPGSLSAVRMDTTAGRHREKYAPFIRLRTHSIVPARHEVAER
jgi:hypothetical protein